MNIEQKTGIQGYLPELRALIEANPNLPFIGEIDGHELPPSLGSYSDRILKVVMLRHVIGEKTTYKDLAPIFGESIATRTIQIKIISNISHVNKTLEKEKSHWRIRNVSMLEDQARRKSHPKPSWDLVWEENPSKSITLTLPDGKKLAFSQDNVKGKALQRLLEGKTVSQPDFEPLMPLEKQKNFRKLLGRHGYDLDLTEGFYSLKELHREISAVNPLESQHDPEASVKEVSLKDINNVKRAIGLEFATQVITAIGNKMLKELPRDPGAIFEKIIEDYKIRIDPEIRKSFKSHSASRQIANYVFSATLGEEWFQDPNALYEVCGGPDARRLNLLRSFCKGYRDREIEPERIVSLMRRYFKIPDSTSSPA